ncbi:hypothetical protein L6164_020963 [Bauhinia variegata]|uniref:Uncharacterized protein n=1 Tax=Bauhinia variegata TaxID=167791 RepID=A0ACB9MWZ8_BAUVA|nr:hypothetical protein L6164_020963 [Bauhinia variegata]
MNLSGCELLEELPNMSKASKLEIVDLSRCIRLNHVHHSIISNHNLVELYLTNCKRLQRLQSHVHLRSLKHLSAFNCPNLKEFSISSERLETLSLAWTCIENVSSAITLGLINSLTTLNLNCAKLVSLPASIKHLPNLEQLHLCGCSRLQSIPELPRSIKVLDASNCSSLEAIFTSRPCSHLNPRYPLLLYLSNCWKLGEDTVNAIALDFVLATMGVVYQQPTPSEHFSYCNHSEACLPGSKVPDVLNFQTSQGCESEISIQVPLNSDLMAFIFCFAIGKQTGYQLRCCCSVHVSNGERIEYNKIVLMPSVCGDHLMLCYYGDFNHNIMNGIKESRASSSSTDEYTKVSFKIYDYHRFGVKGIRVCPIYASELHSLFSTNTKKKRKLALQKVVNSLRLSKQLPRCSREEKKKTKKLKAIHLPTAT